MAGWVVRMKSEKYTGRSGGGGVWRKGVAAYDTADD